MSVISYFIWILVGTGLAMLFLQSQYWSVKIIEPTRARQSKWIILGGAVLRWVVVFLVLMVALSYSYTALLVVFVAFLITRMIVVFKWRQLAEINQ